MLIIDFEMTERELNESDLIGKTFNELQEYTVFIIQQIGMGQFQEELVENSLKEVILKYKRFIRVFENVNLVKQHFKNEELRLESELAILRSKKKHYKEKGE